MTMRLLFKVEDRFYISGRGCVIVPAIPEGSDLGYEGAYLQTHIGSILPHSSTIDIKEVMGCPVENPHGMRTGSEGQTQHRALWRSSGFHLDIVCYIHQAHRNRLMTFEAVQPWTVADYEGHVIGRWPVERK
jgi:hypothetical protein